jgi:hypothetical protein
MIMKIVKLNKKRENQMIMLQKISQINKWDKIQKY